MSQGTRRELLVCAAWAVGASVLAAIAGVPLAHSRAGFLFAGFFAPALGAGKLLYKLVGPSLPNAVFLGAVAMAHLGVYTTMVFAIRKTWRRLRGEDNLPGYLPKSVAARASAVPSRPPLFTSTPGGREIVLCAPPRTSALGLVLFVAFLGLALFGVAWIEGGVAGLKIVFPFWLGTCVLVALGGTPKEIRYVTATRTIEVTWRNVILGARRREFPLDRFGSVVSYYPIGEDSRCTVCLMERDARKGLALGSFQALYISRSFWDVVPPLKEAEEATELRTRAAALLGIPDGGYLGTRWPIGSSI